MALRKRKKPRFLEFVPAGEVLSALMFGASLDFSIFSEDRIFRAWLTGGSETKRRPVCQATILKLLEERKIRAIQTGEDSGFYVLDKSVLTSSYVNKI